MPDLSFRIEGVDAVNRGIVPLIAFRLRVTNAPADARIESILLRAQIQFEPARRPYSPEEKAALADIFGAPARWGQTLRNKLWTQVDFTVPAFAGETETRILVPCTYDLHILAAKYLAALEGGDVPLLFLFSGTVFHAGEDGRLQVQQIPWDRECSFRMPVSAWRDLMEGFFPGCGWLMLGRDTLDRLAAFKARRACATWDQVVDTLLEAGNAVPGMEASP